MANRTAPEVESPHVYPALYELRQRLRAHDLETELKEGRLLVLAPPNADGAPRLGDTVECRPRPVDGDRLWFFIGGDPIEQASHVTDAAIAIASRLHRQDA